MEVFIKWLIDVAKSLFGTEVLPASLKWLILGGLFIFIELTHRSWMIIWFALGSLAAAVLAIFLQDAELAQISVFFGVTTVSLGVYVYIRSTRPEPEPEDVHIRPGREVVCVKPIGNGERPGVIKVDGNNYFARLADGHDSIKKDDWVIIEGWYDRDSMIVAVKPRVK